MIIKYIPLQQGLRLTISHVQRYLQRIIKYIPLQQGLRPFAFSTFIFILYTIIKYIPLQ